MGDQSRSIGCFGFLTIALILGFLAWIFLTIPMADKIPKPDLPKVHEPTGPEFTTIEAQLTEAHDQKRLVTQIHLAGASAPLVGQWTVQQIGYDVVVLNGSIGELTLKIEAIVGVQVAHEEGVKPEESKVEK